MPIGGIIADFERYSCGVDAGYYDSGQMIGPTRRGRTGRFRKSLNAQCLVRSPQDEQMSGSLLPKDRVLALWAFRSIRQGTSVSGPCFRVEP